MDEPNKPSPTPAQEPSAQPAPSQDVPEPAEGVTEKPVNNTGQTGPKNIAWDRVLKDYCTATKDGRYHSLSELAKKYDVAESTIRERSARENWPTKRTESIRQAEELAAEENAKQITDANNRHLSKWRRIQDLANKLLDNFESRLKEFDEAQAKLSELKAQDSNAGLSPEEVKELKKIRQPGISNLNQITTTLKTAIEGERIVLGLPIMVTKSDVNATNEVSLPAETITEIDRLFELNKNEQSPSTNPNS